MVRGSRVVERAGGGFRASNLVLGDLQVVLVPETRGKLRPCCSCHRTLQVLLGVLSAD
jgi:hypothetical protein